MMYQNDKLMKNREMLPPTRDTVSGVPITRILGDWTFVAIALSNFAMFVFDANTNLLHWCYLVPSHVRHISRCNMLHIYLSSRAEAPEIISISSVVIRD